MPLLKVNQPRKCMPWGAVAGAVASYGLNKMGSKDKNGGAGTTTASKEPWSAVAPILQNMAQQGSDLNAYYQAVPFNEQQKQAYANSYALSDKMRDLVPGLLSQMQAQPGGFDRNNPTAKPDSSWDWGSTGWMGAGAGGSMTAAAQADAAARAAKPAPVAPAAPAADPMPAFDPYMSGQELAQYYYKKNLAANLAAGGNGGFTPYLPYLGFNAGGSGWGAATDDGGAAAAVGSSANF